MNKSITQPSPDKLARDIYDFLYAKKGAWTSKKRFIKKKFLPMLKRAGDGKDKEVSLDSILASLQMQEFKDDVLIEIVGLLRYNSSFNSWILPCLFEIPALVKNQKKKNLLYIQLAQLYSSKRNSYGFNKDACLDLMLESYSRVQLQDKDDREQLARALENDNVEGTAEYEFKFGSKERALKAFKLIGEEERAAVLETMYDSIHRKNKGKYEQDEQYKKRDDVEKDKESKGIDAVLKGE